MIYLIIPILALGIITALITLLSKDEEGRDKPVITKQTCYTCNGDNDLCEQECMMEAATKEVEYYDDEELDRFKGRLSNEYTNEEADEFSEVMLTMKQNEVKGWNRSLILRGINMPNQIKDEYIALAEQQEQ